jgi:hypothetical protein
MRFEASSDASLAEYRAEMEGFVEEAKRAAGVQ